MGIKNILWDEIEKEIKELSKMQVGTEQYKVTVDGIARLSDKIIELEKLESENAAKDFENFARTEEQELKREQLKSEKRDRAVKNVITVGTAVLSVAVYALALQQTLSAMGHLQRKEERTQLGNFLSCGSDVSRGRL